MEYWNSGRIGKWNIGMMEYCPEGMLMAEKCPVRDKKIIGSHFSG